MIEDVGIERSPGTAAASGPPAIVRWAQARGWGPWRFSLTAGAAWGVLTPLLWDGVRFLLGLGDPAALGPYYASATAVAIYFGAWLVAGLLLGAVFLRAERAHWPARRAPAS